jgi:hypothetical protein
MKYIGCDFHPSFQKIAVLNENTGEMVVRRLGHGGSEVKQFYEALGEKVVVGVEATGSTYWFERFLKQLGHEFWLGDAGEIRRQDGRKQKHDTRDARLILRLLLEERFPRIWIPKVEERDLRQLLLHRWHLVRMRTRIKNQLQHIALNQLVATLPCPRVQFQLAQLFHSCLAPQFALLLQTLAPRKERSRSPTKNRTRKVPEKRLLALFLLRLFHRRRLLLFLARRRELDFARINLFLRDLAGLFRRRCYQRGRSAGELAGAARRHQNVAVVTVETIFELHRSPLLRWGADYRRNPEYP